MNTQNPPHLRGLIAATHTPFHPNGALNPGMVEQQAGHLLKHHLTTAFIGGSTGESQSLPVEERRALATRWFEVVRGSEPPTHFKAVDVREHDVQDHEVWRSRSRRVQGGKPRGRHGHLIAHVAQRGGEELGDGGLVVHHEDPWRGLIVLHVLHVFIIARQR